MNQFPDAPLVHVCRLAERPLWQTAQQRVDPSMPTDPPESMTL
jgi:hypothetical protein